MTLLKEVKTFGLPPDGCPRMDFSIFDLAVLDFQMPQMNGKDLLLRMRAMSARFPIILLSGGAADATGEQEMERDTGSLTSPTHDEIIGPHESDAD